MDEAEFYRRLPEVRAAAGDRAVLRAMHIFDDNRRVTEQTEALRSERFDSFLRLVNKSGESSWKYLQNVIPSGSSEHQEMAFAIALCKKLLTGRGAVTVGGKVWTARAEHDAPIAAGTTATVLRIEGVKLIVTPVCVRADANE